MIVRLLLLSLILVAAVIGGALLGMRQARSWIFYSDVQTMSGPRRAVVTLLDYFASGQREVDAYVGRQADRRRERLEKALDDGRRACVRVHITLKQNHQGSFQSADATGVLIDQGRLVLTAGHALEGYEGRQATVILMSGRALPARVLDHEYELFGGAERDWAILRVDRGGQEVPSVPLGTIEFDELAVCMGYPAGIGLNSGGQITYDSSVHKSYLAPLSLITRVDGTSPLELSPVAGSVPIDGMSGAPVFNLNSELVGIFVSVATRGRETGVRFSFGASPVAPLRERLEAASRSQPEED